MPRLREPVRRATYVTADPSLERLRELLVEITETPAPTFEEAARGELVARKLSATGLSVAQDEVGNVVARLPGDGPTVVVAAHLDTVFPAGTEVRVRSDDARLAAPGIGDNSASLAVLVHWVECLREGGGVDPERGGASGRRANVVVAATVGEEGLGDLRGARHLVDVVEPHLFIALDGHLGTVVGRSVGSKRFEVQLHATGGHSWGDFPSPSAVHALGDAIHAVTRIPLPSEPRSSFNVGQVRGGRSVNAIAEEAWCDLDLRSVDAEELERLEREALKRIRSAARAHGVTLEVTPVGHRPTARVDNEALVRAARGALERVGVVPRVVASSTDANAAMAAGVPAIAFGVYRGGDAHRRSEWLDPASLPIGFEAFAALMDEITGSVGAVPAEEKTA